MAFVCYGDFILLRGEEFGGFLTSFSFTDPACFLQEASSDLREVANHRAMIFEVLPKLMYDNVKELRQLQTASPIINTTFKSSPVRVLRATTALEKDEILKFVSLSQRVAAEDEVNNRTIQQRRGENVLYGQEVQLRHAASMYFLKQRPESAEHDKSCINVETSSTGSSGVHFKVESRYQFKSEGDKVIYEDFMHLRSSKSGLYLHISDKSLEAQGERAIKGSELGRVLDFAPHPSVYTKTFEVNMAYLKSVWQPVLYRPFSVPAGALCSGSVLQFRHTERVGLAVSEGVDYTNDGLAEVLILISKEGNLSHTHSGSLLQLEVDTEKIHGGHYGYLKDGQPNAYRLRHLTSGRLCAVVKSAATLSLSPHSHEASPQDQLEVMRNSAFRLVPTTVVRDNQIKSDTVVRVESAYDGSCLATTNIEFSRKFEKPLLQDSEAYFKPLEYEGALQARYKVTAVTTTPEDEAYLVTCPSAEEVQDAEFIKSSQGFLYLFGSLLRDGLEPEISQLVRMQRLLSQLIMFCIEADSDDPFTCEGKPTPRRQQFMRELGIIDLVCRMLSYAFDTGIYQLEELTQAHGIIRVCSLCYRLLKHISADDRANEMYCAQWMGLFLNHVQRCRETNSFSAEETLIEILNDNKPLLEHVVTPEMISRFVELLRLRERDPKYMKLLTVLCTSQGEAIESNQNAISELVLNNPENCNTVLMRVRHVNSVIEVEVSEYARWVKLAEIEEISERKDSKRIYKYFLGLLELIAELAYGRNRNTGVLQQIYSFDVCFACGADSQLNYAIRSRFVRILLYLHIDQGDLQRLSLPNYARVFSDISTLNSFPRAKGVIPPVLEIVKHFVYNFLRDLEGVLRAYELAKNHLVKELLVLTQFMVEYGLYINEEELEAMIDPLVYILDGTTDVTAENSDFQSAAIQASGVGKGKNSVFADAIVEAERQKQVRRYEVKDGNIVIMECKVKICSILLSIINVRLDMKLSNFLISFRDNASYSRSANDTPLASLKHSRQESTDQLIPLSSLKRRGKKVRPELEHRGPLAWLNDILEDSTLDLQECTSKNFVAVLMDLLLYQHQPLVTEAFMLTFSYFTQQHALLNALLNVQLLENEESIHALSSLNEQYSVLRIHADNAEFWLGRQYDLGFTNPRVLEQYATDSLTLTVHQRICDIISGLAKLCYKETSRLVHSHANDEPDFERTVWKSDSETSITYETEGKVLRLSKLAEASTDAGQLDPEIFTESEVPSRSFQRLLRNLKVFESILELVKFPALDQFYSAERHQLVLRFCFVFLAKFCRNNPQNQELLSNSAEVFIQAIPTSVFAITLIREIYQNNADLCLRLPIKHIRSFVKAIGETPLSAKKCFIIRTLEIFITVNGKVLRRNQIEVMSQLTSYEVVQFRSLYDSPEAMTELQRMSTGVIRQYVMHAAKANMQGIAVPLEVQYFMEMLLMMGKCAEGKNSQAEETCQFLIPLTKLLELLSASSLFWPLKQVLVMFFYEVYLNVEDSVHEDEGITWVIVKDLVSDLAYIYDNYTKAGQQFSLSVELVRFHFYDKDVDLSESALTYVYEAIIPALRQVFLRRGANIPTEWTSDILKPLVNRICDFHRISPKPEYSHLSSDFLILMSEAPRLQAYLEGISISEIISSREAYNKQEQEEVLPSETKQPGQKGAELMKIVHELLDDESVQMAVQEEFSEIVLSFRSSARVSELAFGPSFTIEPKMIFAAAVTLLGSSDLSVSVVQRGLRLLRRSVEAEVREAKGLAADWDTDDWIEYQEAVEKQQSLLAEVGCVQLLCQLLASKKDTELEVECELLAIAILLGGNRDAQTSFSKALQADSENIFLVQVHQSLSRCFDLVRKEENSKLHVSQKELSDKSILNNTSVSEASSSDEELQVGEGIDKTDEEYRLEKEHFAPFGRLINMLRFLQLLCEGHFSSMQDQLREQWIGGTLHGKSVDFVLIISGYLGTYTKILHFSNIRLGYQLLDTLTEMVQGPCRGNQRLLSQPKSIDTCRDLLTCLKHSSDQAVRGFRITSQRQISALKSKTVNFLLSLLEGDADVEITRQIADSLDVRRCKERMLEVFKTFVAEQGLDFTSSVLSTVDRSLTRESFEGAIEEGFNLYILLRKLADDYPPAQEFVSPKSFLDDEELVAFTFFKRHTARIEVVIEGRLQRTYFPIPPICSYISTASRAQLVASVNRDSASGKVTDMLVKADDVIAEMNHNYDLAQKKFTITSDGVTFLRQICALLALVINYLLMVNYDFTQEENNYLSDDYRLIIESIGGVVFALAIIILVLWCVLKARLIVQKGWKQLLVDQKFAPEVSIPPNTPVAELSKKKALNILLRYGPDSPVFNQEGKRQFGSWTTSSIYLLMCVGMVLRYGTFQYYVLYIVFTAMGWWDVFFYSILLLDAMYMFPTLHTVVKALTTNGNQILMTSLLGLVLVYIYALWGFYIDPRMYYDYTIFPFGESLCQSLWECFLTTLNNGLRLTGGIGDILVKVPWDEKGKYYNKWFFEFSYFLIVVVLILNIFLGIIVSTFAQLRDEKKSIQQDTENCCFICNIDRQTFDKDGDGFEHHIKHDHYLWNYISYKVHLMEKDQTEYTGVETYVAEMLRDGNIAWLPLHKALVLGEESEEKHALEEFIEQLETLAVDLRTFEKRTSAAAK